MVLSDSLDLGEENRIRVAMVAKINPTGTNRAQLQIGLPGIFSEIALNDKGGEFLDKESNFSYKGLCFFGTKRFHSDIHLLYVVEDVLRAAVTLLTMRAGARFTVSPFIWASRMVRFLVLEGVCCIVVERNAETEEP